MSVSVETNNIIAEWLGFTRQTKRVHYTDRGPEFEGLTTTEEYWVSPDGYDKFSGGPPLFSLDVTQCLKHIPPELEKRGCDIELFTDCGMWFCHIHKQGESYNPPVANSAAGEEEPQRAVCEAVLLFIKRCE